MARYHRGRGRTHFGRHNCAWQNDITTANFHGRPKYKVNGSRSTMQALEKCAREKLYLTLLFLKYSIEEIEGECVLQNIRIFVYVPKRS